MNLNSVGRGISQGRNANVREEQKTPQKHAEEGSKKAPEKHLEHDPEKSSESFCAKGWLERGIKLRAKKLSPTV